MALDRRSIQSLCASNQNNAARKLAKYALKSWCCSRNCQRIQLKVEIQVWRGENFWAL